MSHVNGFKNPGSKKKEQEKLNSLSYRVFLAWGELIKIAVILFAMKLYSQIKIFKQ